MIGYLPGLAQESPVHLRATYYSTEKRPSVRDRKQVECQILTTANDVLLDGVYLHIKYGDVQAQTAKQKKKKKKKKSQVHRVRMLKGRRAVGLVCIFMPARGTISVTSIRNAITHVAHPKPTYGCSRWNTMGVMTPAVARDEYHWGEQPLARGVSYQSRSH